MATIKDIANGETDAYELVKDELETTFDRQIHQAHSALVQAAHLLWLLPHTEKQKALYEKLGAITSELNYTFYHELADYKKEWEDLVKF